MFYHSFRILSLFADQAWSLLDSAWELCLLCLTFPGPWMILTLILVANAYLAVKPVAQHLLCLGGRSYAACFHSAKVEVALLFRWFGRTYFNYEVVGLDNIPSEGGALLVYYHGAIPMDYIFLSCELLLRRGRHPRSVADKVMVRMPFFGMLKGFGCFAGTREVSKCRHLKHLSSSSSFISRQSRVSGS